MLILCIFGLELHYIYFHDSLWEKCLFLIGFGTQLHLQEPTNEDRDTIAEVSGWAEGSGGRKLEECKDMRGIQS